MQSNKSQKKKTGSLPSGDSATYVTRPKRKPSMTTKGKLNEWDNGYKEFIPQGQKPSNRTMLKQLGGSSFYKSEGEKESSYSIHINVDGQSVDPVNEAREIFDVLTKGERKTAPKLPADGEGRMLYDDGQVLQVWLDTARHEVQIMTRLVCTHQIERQLLQAQAAMNVAVGRHRQEILNNQYNDK